MFQTRARKVAVSIAGAALAALLLAGAGTVQMVRRGTLPPFVTDIPVWPGVSLTMRNGPEGVCHPRARCPRQIGLQPGLSIWLTSRARGQASRSATGRRLLFLPSNE